MCPPRGSPRVKGRSTLSARGCFGVYWPHARWLDSLVSRSQGTPSGKGEQGWHLEAGGTHSGGWWLEAGSICGHH